MKKLILFTTIVLFLTSTSAHAFVCRVGAFRTLKTITAALALPVCSTIRVDRGTYNETFEITRPVNIVGRSMGKTIIDGAAVADSVVSIAVGPADKVTLSKLMIRNGNSGKGGGGVYLETGDVTLSKVLIQDNLAYMSSGGGINCYAGTLTVEDSVITNNEAESSGGGLSNYGCTVTITGSSITANTADSSGGGIESAKALSLTDSVVTDNTALWNGGGIHAYNDLSLNNTQVSRNSTSLSDGGGIYFDNSSSTGLGLSLSQSTVSDNVADRGGGLHLISSALVIVPTTITDSLFSGNVAWLDGGAIFTQTDIDFSNTTFSGNQANRYGGALQYACLYVGVTSQSAMNNVTITDNTAGVAGGGLSVAYSTYYTCSITAEFSNSIVSDNSPDGCINYVTGGIASTGYNLDEDGTCGFTAAGDLTGVSALLDVLADNGGPTQTHLPTSASPVIDAGDTATCEAADQRGITRPQGVACDMGAVEVEAP